MLVKELLLAKPVVCSIDDNIQKSAQIMAENNLECLPVVESLAHNNLLGVISSEDICRQAIALGLNPLRTTVGRVMNSRFLTVDSEAEVNECFRKLKASRSKFIFVTDENNSCIGVLSEDDLSHTENQFSNQTQSVYYISHDRIF